MRIDLFKMERTQVLYEHVVDYNLSESGVAPLRVGDLVDDPSGLLDTKLSYPWGDGSPELRENIASWYEGAGPENVTIANGSSEANFIEFWHLLDKGDRAAIMLPNYLQTWGLARHFTGRADTYNLKRERGGGRWALDVDSLARAVNKRTKLILVTNPNNPTGGVLTEDEMDEIVRQARRVGAWIVADEVYRGAEVDGGELTPTFWGRYPKVLITSGLSKAFGLPGLRIGWVLGPQKKVEQLAAYRDYTTLAPSMVSDKLAAIAMVPKRRDQILARTREIVASQWPQMRSWAQGHDDVLTWTAPVAGAIAIFKYDLPVSSIQLFDRLREEKSVLITPGAHFGLAGKHFRAGYGYDIEDTLKGLERISEFIHEVRR